MKRYAMWLVMAAVLSLASGCKRQTETPAAEAAKPEPLKTSTTEVRLPRNSEQISRIKVAAVETARVALDEVIAPGKIESNPNRISRVVMPVAGRVKQVMVIVGDAVKEGQPLLMIDSPEASAAIANYQQARARVNETKATLAKAEADLSRAKDLFAGRAIAQKEVLAAEAGLAQARSAGEQAQAGLDEMSRRLEILGLKPGEMNPSIAVRSPLSGKVLDLAVTAGEYRNDTSAPLMTIADLSTVFMAADVPESQIRLVAMGEHVQISLSAYPGETFTGRVTRIADVVDPQTRTVKVRAALNNAKGKFRPDMFGEMQHDETFRDVPILPSAAVIQTNQQSIVYREKELGVYEPVAVTFGKQAGDRVPIISGLVRGERVVVDGAMLLKGMQ